MHANRRLYVFLFLLPAFLILLASWEYQRVTLLPEPDAAGTVYAPTPSRAKDQNDVAKDAASTDRFTPRLETLPPRQHDTVRVPDPDAVTRPVRRWMRHLARVAALSALLALFIGSAGLLFVQSAARIALRTRDDLVREFDRAYRRLPYLIAGVTITLTIAVASLLGFETLEFWSSSGPNAVSANLMLFFAVASLATLALLVRAVMALPRAFAIQPDAPMELVAREITRTDAPGLWQWVEHLAARSATAPPERIVAGLTKGFFVMAKPLSLQPAATTITGTILYLPLALMALLDESETAAIICHELAHFSGADHVYSARFRPMYSGIQRSLDAFATAGRTRDGSLALLSLPAFEFGVWCQEQFIAAVMHWRRVREFEADQFGAAIAGRRESAVALVRSSVCAGPLETVHAAVRRAPAVAPADVVREIRAIAARDGFDEPSIHLEEALAHPFDSHPTNRERILALDETVPLTDDLTAMAVRPVLADDTPWCAALFHDFDALTAGLSADYVSAVAREEEAIDAELTSVAAIAEAPREFTERTWKGTMWFGVVSAFCLAFGVTLLGPSEPTNTRLFGAGALVVALLAAWRASYYWRRGRAPFLRLAQAGVTLHGATDEIPWSDVVDIAHAQFKDTITFNFLLRDDVPLALARAHFGRAKYRAATGLLSISVTGIRGTRHHEYITLIYLYHEASQARAILDERVAARQVPILTSFTRSSAAPPRCLPNR